MLWFLTGILRIIAAVIIGTGILAGIFVSLLAAISFPWLAILALLLFVIFG